MTHTDTTRDGGAVTLTETARDRGAVLRNRFQKPPKNKQTTRF